jgi:CheY-like chemotaxis protein
LGPMTVTNHTILLVDDNDDLRMVTIELLEALGHRVFGARRGESALRIFEEHAEEIDLLVIEFVLPVMDGLELAQRLRAWKPSLGVVLTSSHDNHGDLRDRVERGEVVFLRKPFSAEELASKIEAATATRGPDPVPTRRETGYPATRPRKAESTFEPLTEAGSRLREPARHRVSAPKPAGRWSDLGISVTAGAVAFGVFALLTFTTQRPPALPDRVPDSITRGTAVQPIAPVGKVGTMPRELRWRTVEGAHRYQVRLQAVDESTLWQSETELPRVALPEELRGRLHPKVVYSWFIEAFDEDGSRLSVSERVSFVVDAPPDT